MVLRLTPSSMVLPAAGVGVPAGLTSEKVPRDDVVVVGDVTPIVPMELTAMTDRAGSIHLKLSLLASDVVVSDKRIPVAATPAIATLLISAVDPTANALMARRLKERLPLLTR